MGFVLKPKDMRPVSSSSLAAHLPETSSSRNAPGSSASYGGMTFSGPYFQLPEAPKPEYFRVPEGEYQTVGANTTDEVKSSSMAPEAPEEQKPKVEQKKSAQKKSAQKVAAKAVEEDVKTVAEETKPELVNKKAVEQQNEANDTKKIEDSVDKQTPDAPVDNSKPDEGEPSQSGYVKQQFENSPEGTKWRDFMQGKGTMFGVNVPGFMVAGSRSADMVQKNAALERDPKELELEYAKMNQKENAAQRASEQVKVNAREQQNWLSQRNRHIDSRGKGQWSPEYVDPITHKTGDQMWLEHLNQIDDNLRRLGYNGPLQPAPLRAGGFQQMNTALKDKARANITTLKSMNDTVTRWLDDGTLKRAVADPNSSEAATVTTFFDKMGEFVVTNLAGGGGVIADAEKIRMQYEIMSSLDKEAFDGFKNSMFNALNRLIDVGTREKMSASGDATLKYIADGLDEGDWAKVLYGVANVSKDNTPMGLGEVFDSIKTQYDNYINQFMMNGNVDRAAVWRLARILLNRENEKYSDAYKKLGLGDLLEVQMAPYDKLLEKYNIRALGDQKIHMPHLSKGFIKPPKTRADQHGDTNTTNFHIDPTTGLAL